MFYHINQDVGTKKITYIFIFYGKIRECGGKVPHGLLSLSYAGNADF